MKVIQLPIKSGKTMIAIRQAVDTNSILIVPEESDLIRCKQLYHKLINCEECEHNHKSNTHLDIMTVENYLRNLKEFKNKPVIIDDFDKVLEQLLSIKSSLVTITVGY